MQSPSSSSLNPAECHPSPRPDSPSQLNPEAPLAKIVFLNVMNPGFALVSARVQKMAPPSLAELPLKVTWVRFAAANCSTVPRLVVRKCGKTNRSLSTTIHADRTADDTRTIVVKIAPFYSKHRCAAVNGNRARGAGTIIRKFAVGDGHRAQRSNR